MNTKTIILCGLAILVIAVLTITAAGGFFGWFGPRTLIVNDDGKADYEIIQKAIDDARSGDTIFVRNGIYCENLRITKSIKLVGEDKNNTIIDAGGEGRCIYVTADNVHISDFTLQNGEWGIYLESSSKCVLTQNNIIDIKPFYGLFVEGKYDNSIDESNTINGKPVYYFHDIHRSRENPEIIENKESLGSVILSNCTHFILRNNTIANGDGILLMDSSKNILRGNKILKREHIKPNERAGAYSMQAYYGLYYGLWVEGAFDNDIDQSNKINDKPIYYFHDTHGTTDDSKIIENKSAGAIILANCTHFIVRNNTLEGGDGILLIQSSNNNIIYNIANSNNYNGISLISSSDNNIANNTASRKFYLLAVQINGIQLDSSRNNNITYNTVRYNYNGISLISSDNNNIKSNNIANNNRDGIKLNLSSNNNVVNNTANFNSFGITLVSSSNNNIANNTANYNKGGISLYPSSNNTITYNTANNNSLVGILLNSSSNNNNIANNTANYNDLGISLISSSSNNNITCNTANYNDYYGIWLDSSSNNTMTNNTVLNNEVGIWLFSSNFSSILNNTITNNRIGIKCEFSSDLSIHYNCIYSNTEYGVFNEASTYINATYNWWKGIPNITGDSVSGNVTYIPYLHETQIVITSPNNQSAFALGQTITFNSSLLGDFVPYTYNWISNIDGYIGNEKTFKLSKLSAGIHTINLIVKDSNGSTLSDTITIAIKKPPEFITENESWSDENITLDEDLIILEGGNLTLNNVTLKINCSLPGHYRIVVQNGASLHINNSNITSTNPGNNFLFQVYNGTTFEMKNSELHGCGYSLKDDKLAGLWINANHTTIEKNVITNNLNGLIFYQSNNNNIINNNIVYNDFVGIGLDSSNNNNIANNTAHHNNLIGITLNSSINNSTI